MSDDTPMDRMVHTTLPPTDETNLQFDESQAQTEQSVLPSNQSTNQNSESQFTSNTCTQKGQPATHVDDRPTQTSTAKPFTDPSPKATPAAQQQNAGNPINLQQTPTYEQCSTAPHTQSDPTLRARHPTTPRRSGMELAIGELRNTIDEAEQYQQIQKRSPRHLASHAKALDEDIGMVAGLETSDDVLRTSAAHLIFRGRRLKRQLERESFEAKSEPNAAMNSPPHSRTEKNTGLKLTPLKVPEFDGTTSQFFVFRSFFEENVLQNTNLTDTSKWMRLRECVKGQPAQLLAKLPQTAHTLQVAWKLLQDVYGGDDKTVIELYDQIRNLAPATSQTQSLRMTHSELEGIFLSLEHIGHDVEGSHYLKGVMISKFPTELLYQVQKMRTIPLSNLRQILSDLIANREIADFHKTPTSQPTQKQRYTNPTNRAHTGNIETPKPPLKAPASYTRVCIFCTSDHWNDECTVYTTINSRKEKITGKCLKCLKILHPGQACIGKIKCYHCDSYEHNRALCPLKFQIETPKAPTLVMVDTQPQRKKTGYFMTFLAQATSPHSNHAIQIRVIVDTAGGATLLRREAAKLLNLPIRGSNKTSYTGLGATSVIQGNQLDDPIQLQTISGTLLDVYPAVVENIVPTVPSPNIQQFQAQNPQYSGTYIPPTGDGKPIDLLLGSDAMVDILLPQSIIHVNADTLLMPTKFGSLLLGRQKEQLLQVCHTTNLNFTQNPLKLISDLDLVGLAELHNSDIEEEQQAIRSFYETLTLDQGRYSISWPWRTQPPNLDTNYGLALGRLRSLHKRLLNTPHLLAEYHGIIMKQLHDDIIEKVEKTIKPTGPIHYLPHHPVLQPEKSTTVRPVYDGAAKTHPTKLSLNDNILKGTKWLNDLVATLLRFRRYQTAVIADIEKAFHQIAINENDRDVVRFLWLKNHTEPPTDENIQIYRFRRVAFGVVASPFILSATINYHALQQKPNVHLDILLKDLYADNLVSSLQSTVDANKFYEYTKQFFGGIKMNLTKWTTNNETLRNSIPHSDKTQDIVQNVLGLKWNIRTDTISLKIPESQIAQPATRRTIAREMAENFDPLGWASPVLLLAKIFFRTIWSDTEKWDENLNEDYTKSWKIIHGKLQDIKLIKLPRQMARIETAALQIHTFVDASAQAYAVVSYLRAQDGETVQTSIIASKSRLTPKKQVSIPKLELVAAVLGCKFTTFLKNSLQLPHTIPTYLWSDSKCVIAWMEQKRLLPPIIHKYVEQAKAHNITQIRYVPSEWNYADVATRGATIQELHAMDWWVGPQWLSIEDKWPTTVAIQEPENEISLIFQHKLMTVNTLIGENDTEGLATINIKHFSTLTKLLKITALVFTAAQKFRKNEFLKADGQLDLNTARMEWIKWDQNRQYRIAGEPNAGKEFKLRNISVFRDKHGLIRCQTRIVNSFMNLNTTQPVLLVKKSTLTTLIVLHTHEQHYHAGTSHTLANIRKEFWLPQGRRQIYSIILNQCYRCRKYGAQAYATPPPIPLPQFRITHTQKPFQTIGIDVFGPIIAVQKQNNKITQIKIWGLILTCSVIRAVHIEILEDMTTHELLLAIRRFVSRRGVPQRIISDNAPAFHALDDCIRDLWRETIKAPSVSNYLANNRIEWKFISQTAPWMGGFYERLIQSVKIALEKTYGNKIMPKKQLETTLIEIEAIINSRPISYVDRELDSPIITPNDFLTAQFTSIPIDTNKQSTDNYLNKLWKSSQNLLHQFWRNWAEQYLLMLRERHDQLRAQSGSNQRGPQKGDIVVMMEKNIKRSQWQLAVVERTIQSSDGVIRSVQIRIPKGSRLIRPVITLAPLNLIADLPKIQDHQLNKRRDAIIIWPAEDASQNNSNSNTQNRHAARTNNEERVSEGETGGREGSAEPYHSNGLENELGPGVAGSDPCGTETHSARDVGPGVSWSHE